MHMGALAVVGQTSPSNLKHVVINNGTHDSVGGQPSAAQDEVCFRFPQLALACGYKQVTTTDDLTNALLFLKYIN